MADSESFPELAEKEEGALCAAKYPEDGCWYRAQIVVEGSEGTEVLFMDYGNASIATELRALPEELKSKPALSRKCALQKPRDVKTWSRKSEVKFNEMAAEGATIFKVQFIASGDISIVELYLDGKSVTDELAALCEMPLATERPAPLGQEILSNGIVSHSNGPADFYFRVDDPDDKMANALRDSDAFEDATEIKVGSLVAAKWDKDGTWYRAKVIELCDVGAVVKFLDFGNEARCGEFKQLPSELSSLEPLALHCALAVQNIDEAQTHAFEKIAGNPENTVQIEFLDATKKPRLVRLLFDGEDVSQLIMSEFQDDVVVAAAGTTSEQTIEPVQEQAAEPVQEQTVKTVQELAVQPPQEREIDMDSNENSQPIVTDTADEQFEDSVDLTPSAVQIENTEMEKSNVDHEYSGIETSFDTSVDGNITVIENQDISPLCKSDDSRSDEDFKSAKENDPAASAKASLNTSLESAKSEKQEATHYEEMERLNSSVESTNSLKMYKSDAEAEEVNTSVEFSTSSKADKGNIKDEELEGLNTSMESSKSSIDDKCTTEDANVKKLDTSTESSKSSIGDKSNTEDANAKKNYTSAESFNSYKGDEANLENKEVEQQNTSVDSSKSEKEGSKCEAAENEEENNDTCELNASLDSSTSQSDKEDNQSVSAVKVESATTSKKEDGK